MVSRSFISLIALAISAVAFTARADSIPSFGLAAEDTITVLGVRPLPATRFVSPIIANDLSKLSGNNRKEAWVHIKLHLTPGGEVTRAELVEAFPRDYYEKAVLKVARGWKFPPSNDTEMDVGVAIYTDLYENQRNPSVIDGHVRGVSLYNFTSLQKVYNDLVKHTDLDAAGRRLDILGKRLADNNMTVTDAARYFASMTRYERLKGNYNTSLAYARATLLLAHFLDSPKVVYGIHLEVMSALLASGRNDDAVDYYDQWRKISKEQLAPEAAAHMEELRAAGAGKGHPYTIVDYSRFRALQRHQMGGSTTTVRPDPNSGFVAELQEDVMQTSLERISLDFPEAQASALGSQSGTR